MTVYYMNILYDTKSSVNIIGFLHGTVASVVALGPRGHGYDFRGAPNAKKSLISTFGTIWEYQIWGHLGYRRNTKDLSKLMRVKSIVVYKS